MISEGAAHIVISALLADFGAIAHVLCRKNKTAAPIASLASGCLVAAFSGVMANFASDYFNFNSSLTYIAAGISGWAGPEMIDMAVSLFLKKTGLKAKKIMPKKPKTEPHPDTDANRVEG